MKVKILIALFCLLSLMQIAYAQGVETLPLDIVGIMLIVVGIIILVCIVAFLWALYDILMTSANETKWKIIWVAVCLFLGLLGVIIYILIGRKHKIPRAHAAPKPKQPAAVAKPTAQPQPKAAPKPTPQPKPQTKPVQKLKPEDLFDEPTPLPEEPELELMEKPISPPKTAEKPTPQPKPQPTPEPTAAPKPVAKPTPAQPSPDVEKENALVKIKLITTLEKELGKDVDIHISGIDQTPEGWKAFTELNGKPVNFRLKPDGEIIGYEEVK